jgi:hypothetical protein
MKTVWIINQYITTPEIEGDGYRHYYFAKELKDKGYDCVLITSSFSHLPFRHNKFVGLYKFVNKGVKTLILKGNKYGRSQGVGRILSWIIYSLNLLILPLIPKRKLPRPDVIVLSSLPLLPILNIVLFKAIFYPKVKIVFEIRDLWPLSAVDLGGYSKSNPFIRFLSYLEKLSYRKADLIISVLPRADLHIREVLGHGNFRYVWLTNGYSIPESKGKLELSEVLDVKIRDTDFNIGYAGTLVIANPLDTVIEVVGNHNDRSIHLYILGGGPERDRILKLSDNYDNVHVLDRIPKKYVPSFLEKMDLLFMGKGGKGSSIYKYGTSQLKTFDYFYARKPIIQALNSDENPVTYSGAGYVIEPENSQQLIERIDYFRKLSKAELDNYGSKGYDYLLENCTYRQISKRFKSELDSLFT